MISALASLYSTSALAVVRMIVIKNSDNSWLERTSISFKSTRYLQMIWAYVIAMSITPLLGFGRYGQDMVNIRFALFFSHEKWNYQILHYVTKILAWP